MKECLPYIQGVNSIVQSVRKNMTFFNFTVENLLYVTFVLIIIQTQVKANKLNFNCVSFGLLLKVDTERSLNLLALENEYFSGKYD